MSSVLVANGNHGERELLCSLLRREGFEVVEASDGREAVLKYRSGPTNVVIIALPMAGLEGIATIHQLAVESPTVRIIAIAGKNPPLGVIHGAEVMGASRVLSKPFTLEHLFRVVQEEAMPERCLQSH